MLGLAFPPNYVTNGFFFVNYRNTAGNTVIARYSVSANATISNTTGTILITIAQPYFNHNGGCSITQGYFYDGTTYPNFQNKYFFTDYCQNRIGYVDASNAITYSANFAENNNFITFGEDINGELYVASGGGTIYKVIDSSLGNSEFEKSGFALYPNPAKDSFFL